MSIATKTGDTGTTGLMYNRRVSKCHPRVEACGSIDEINTALGMARALADDEYIQNNLLAVQKDLIILMGELATQPEDLPRYVKDGFKLVAPALTEKLDQIVQQIESQEISFKGWATPGATPLAAALDVARTTCRRGERRVCALQESGDLRNPEILTYLNRLSDALWLMSRRVETP